MDCYICNSLTQDENHCEFHRYKLQPLQDFMASHTGCDYYLSLNNPFMFIELDHIAAIKGFIAGARFSIDFIKINNYWRLTSTNEPYFNYSNLI